MRRLAREGAAVWIVSLAILGALANTAMGAGRGERVFFHLQASNGYRVYAVGEGATGALVVTRGRHPHRPGASASVYIARAKTGGDRFEAKFGSLGRVALRFHPSGRVTYSKARRHCRGPDRYTTHYGVFVGAVRFTGEGGYTSAQAHRVSGRVVTPATLHCAGFIAGLSQTTIWRALSAPSTMSLGTPRSPGTVAELRSAPSLPHLFGGRGRRTVLQASWHRGVAAQAFGAVERGHRRAGFFAGTLQSEGRLAVIRLAAAIGSPADLLASDSLSAATVTPPAPFAGEGAFRHADDGTKSWTGSLTVSFPGAPDVPLTGTQFKVGLSRGF
jgi:hypothetical protein